MIRKNLVYSFQKLRNSKYSITYIHIGIAPHKDSILSKWNKPYIKKISYAIQWILFIKPHAPPYNLCTNGFNYPANPFQIAASHGHVNGWHGNAAVYTSCRKTAHWLPLSNISKEIVLRFLHPSKCPFQMRTPAIWAEWSPV